jgi:N-acetylglucosamine-6-phosphate deacetylase
MENKMDSLIIKNGNIVTEFGVIENGFLFVEDGYIRGIYTDQDGISGDHSGGNRPDRMVDAEGGWVLPGFIDVHVHGGYGADFMDASKESLDAITRFHGLHGTTTMLATTVTASRQMLSDVLDSVCEYIKDGMPYAQLLGVHLEGPFISPKWPGAQNPAYIVPPALEWLEEWQLRYPELIRLLTLAPETDGAIKLIGWLRTHGIVAACGHTDATYQEIQTAVEHGLNHAVHTFNAMTGLHHREPGTVGAVLSDDRLSCEVIADGHHVHPIR